MQAKPKICHKCLRLKRLWKSNPPTCPRCIERAPIASKTASKAKRDFKKEIAIFFNEQIERIPAQCQNCGEGFGYMAPWMRKFVLAHILPKAKFKSVATEPENLLFLCVTNGCHQAYDEKGRDHRSAMPCYELAVKQFEKFKHKLSEAEMVAAVKYLNLE